MNPYSIKFNRSIKHGVDQKYHELTSVLLVDIDPEHTTAPAKTRGTSSYLDMIRSMINFALVFGCSPSHGINVDSKFMQNACESIERSMTAQMTVTFPDCLDSMQGDDCNFELASSSTLKPLRLEFTYHVSRFAIGYVFVQEELNGLTNLKGENIDWTGTELTQGIT